MHDFNFYRVGSDFKYALNFQICNKFCSTSLCRYLVASRNKEFSPEVKDGVDTLLMYLYRALDLVPEMENLASSDNSCVVVCLSNI